MHPQDWNLPYRLTILALFCIVMIRSNGTYWIGRGIVAGTSHTRWRRVLETRPYRMGSSWLNRWGPPAVTLSFLVIGLQTMVNLAAGVARMPMRRYLPAVIVGCTVWAFIWGTGGIISLVLLSMAWEHSPAMTITGLAVMAAAVASFFLFGRGRGGQPSKRRLVRRLRQRTVDPQRGRDLPLPGCGTVTVAGLQFGATGRQFLVGHVQRDRPVGNGDGDLVAGAHQRDRPPGCRLR